MEYNEFVELCDEYIACKNRLLSARKILSYDSRDHETFLAIYKKYTPIVPALEVQIVEELIRNYRAYAFNSNPIRQAIGIIEPVTKDVNILYSEHKSRDDNSYVIQRFEFENPSRKFSRVFVLKFNYGDYPFRYEPEDVISFEMRIVSW